MPKLTSFSNRHSILHQPFTGANDRFYRSHFREISLAQLVRVVRRQSLVAIGALPLSIPSLFTVVDPSAIHLKPLCGLRFSPPALLVSLGFPLPSPRALDEGSKLRYLLSSPFPSFSTLSQDFRISRKPAHGALSLSFQREKEVTWNRIYCQQVFIIFPDKRSIFFSLLKSGFSVWPVTVPVSILPIPDGFRYHGGLDGVRTLHIGDGSGYL